MTHQSVSSLDEQIADRQKIQRDLDELLKRGQPTLESVALIQKWDNSNSKTLKVLQELDTILPGTDRIYLSELDVNRSTKVRPHSVACGRLAMQKTTWIPGTSISSYPKATFESIPNAVQTKLLIPYIRFPLKSMQKNFPPALQSNSPLNL